MVKLIEPAFGRSQVNRAGDVVCKRRAPSAELSFADALSVVENWRAAHEFPLQVIHNVVRQKALQINGDATSARRLKRMISINRKLERQNGMRLSAMNDLGGCRVVLDKMADVDEVVRLLTEYPISSFRLTRTPYDYVRQPKDDGYRSIHLVYEYSGTKSRRKVYDGLKVEVQVRTRLQHAWATAIEIVDSFTDQELKAGLGNPQWKRFFWLVSSFVSGFEGFPIVHGDVADLRNAIELRDISRSLGVGPILEGIGATLDRPIGAPLDRANFYILSLNVPEKKIDVEGFAGRDEAIAAYSKKEHSIVDNGSIYVVLVSTQSLSELRQVYPNYYLDTSLFVELLNKVDRLVTRFVESSPEGLVSGLATLTINEEDVLDRALPFLRDPHRPRNAADAELVNKADLIMDRISKRGVEI